MEFQAFVEKCQVHIADARSLAGTLPSGLLFSGAGLYAGFESEYFFHLVVGCTSVVLQTHNRSCFLSCFLHRPAVKNSTSRPIRIPHPANITNY